MLQIQSRPRSRPSDRSHKIVVVLPAYNEASTIAQTITEANDHFSKINPNIEYLVVEDGSTDGTPQVLSRLQCIMPCLRVNSSTRRKGYPTAVRDGLLSVGKDADRILFMDSDGQYDPRDFQKLVRFADNADIVIGRRTSRAESRLRVFLSIGVRLLARRMFGLKCLDITSAFRLMRRGSPRLQRYPATRSLRFRCRIGTDRKAAAEYTVAEYSLRSS